MKINGPIISTKPIAKKRKRPRQEEFAKKACVYKKCESIINKISLLLCGRWRGYIGIEKVSLGWNLDEFRPSFLAPLEHSVQLILASQGKKTLGIIQELGSFRD